jgi:hypothetical protein
VIEHPVWIEKVVTIASEQTGMFYPLVKYRQSVEIDSPKAGKLNDHPL